MASMPRAKPPDLAYFQSIPWCKRLLDAPDIVITPTNSREPKPSTLDSFCTVTLNTKDTIRAWVSFHPKPSIAGERVEELHSLISIGHLLNGYPNVAHGGVVATIIDEVMGILQGVNQRLATLPFTGDTVTAYLNVTYVKPVPTPATVLVTARFREVVGRKHFVDATVQDEAGMVLSRAEGLFVGIGAPDLKEKI